MTKTKKQILSLLILIFLLNLFWELSHSMLYEWDKPPLQDKVNFFIKRIFVSAIGDLFLVAILLFIVTLKNRNLSWLNKLSKSDYLIITILGVLFAILIEIRAFIQQRWSYNEFMPTFFGIGLTPLIQLFTTTFIALWFVKD